jgi:hypothetical protein
MKRLNPALKDMFLKNPRLATAYWNIVRDVGLEGSDEKRAAAVAAASTPTRPSATLDTSSRRHAAGTYVSIASRCRRTTTRGSSSSPSG